MMSKVKEAPLKLFPSESSTTETTEHLQKVQIPIIVLAIDDDLYVLEAITDILAQENIMVISATNGEQGVAFYRQRMDEIKLVLLDVSMWGWSGLRTLQELRKLNPNVKVALSSGYSQMEVMCTFESRHLAGFLQKPYRADQLISHVQQILQNKVTDRFVSLQ